MKLEEFLQTKYNYNPEIKLAMQSYIDLWNALYKGDVSQINHYYVYNGRKKVDKVRFTLNMPKEISEDWSDLLWSEKCEISLKDESSQDQLNELINELDLYSIINQNLEKAGALGTNADVVSVYNILLNEDGMTIDVSDAHTRVDVVDIDWVFPLSWNNKEIYECAFGSIEYIQGKKYIILSVHKVDEKTKNYKIYNHLFLDNKGTITEVEVENDTFKVFDTKSPKKWFSVFRPPLTNNIFKNSPFGLPYYANSVDCIKAVDISFDALKEEIKEGKKRTFARADMFDYDDGEQRLTFDPEDTTIYQLPKGATKDDLIQTDTDELRTSNQIEALNTQLNILGSKVGFGQNHYHFDGENLNTATAVVSSNSKLFRRKKKLEIGYESSIYDLIEAICYASSEFGKYNINTEDMVIKFDDSIIEDKEAESIRAQREVNSGLISKVEYRMRIFGETEEIARKKIEEIEQSNPSIEDLTGTRGEQ